MGIFDEMKLPNMITLSRFLFGICAAVSAFLGSRIWFIMFYLVAVFTDILDGYVARKLKKETKKGAKLDIIADNFLLLSVAVGYYFLRKEILLRYGFQILILLGYFTFTQTVSFVVKRSLIFTRSLAANVAAIIFPIIVILTLFFDSRALIYVYIFLMCYSLSEKLVLKLTGVKKILSSLFSGMLFLFLLIVIIFAMIFVPKNTNYACFKEKCIFLEIKITPEERALGLMYRPSLNEEEGILFIFESDVSHSFWMKNMNFPIDMFFIDSQKNIIDIIKAAQPCALDPCELYTPRNEYRYVIETVDGFSDKYEIEIGQKIAFP